MSWLGLHLPEARINSVDSVMILSKRGVLIYLYSCGRVDQAYTELKFIGLCLSWYISVSSSVRLRQVIRGLAESTTWFQSRLVYTSGNNKMQSLKTCTYILVVWLGIRLLALSYFYLLYKILYDSDI